MLYPHRRVFSGLIIVSAALLAACSAPAPVVEEQTETVVLLSSWNEGPSKAAIVDFVERVTDPQSSDYVPEPERIATFDNDGYPVGGAAHVLPALLRH